MEDVGKVAWQMLYSMVEIRWASPNLHASPIFFPDSNCCLYPKEYVTAPAFLDIKDFVWNV